MSRNILYTGDNLYLRSLFIFASLEAIQIARKEALRFLAEERERIMRLSHKEAIHEVLKWKRIDNRIQTVKTVTGNRLLDTE